MTIFTSLSRKRRHVDQWRDDLRIRLGPASDHAITAYRDLRKRRGGCTLK